VLAVPVILNKIPLATLATILILVDINWPNRRPLFTFGKRKISIYSFYCYLVAVVTTDLFKGVLLGIVISIIFILKEFKRAYSFKKEYVDGDIIHSI
jgi:MFS superfamily sulfate permease-like transporter